MEKEVKIQFSFENEKLANNFLKEIKIKEMKRIKMKKVQNGNKVKFIIKGKEKDVEIAKNSLINDYNLIQSIRRFLYG
jgi:hypothetical protein